MHRHFCRCHDGIVAIAVMALFPSPMRRHLAVVNDDGDGATGDKVDDDVNEDVDSAILLLPSMCRRLCHRHNGVDAVFAMALLPSPMRRHLVIVIDDGDGATGDEVDDNG